MKAEARFQKGERMAAAQTKLDPATDWESIVEGCYRAAHNFVLAGGEWLGQAHQQSHVHRQNVGLLQRSGAPQPARTARDRLEILRAGNVYGRHTNGTAAAEARERLQVIQVWATALCP
jgi:hypothetical protein